MPGEFVPTDVDDDVTTHTRPWLQRRELGPLAHHLGHQIYDAAEAEVVSDIMRGFINRPTSYGFLKDFAWRCIHHLERQPSGACGSDAADELDRLVSIPRQLHAPDSFLPSKNGLTYFSNAAGILNEGFSTGVVVPLLLYRTMTISPDEYLDTRARFSDLSGVAFDAHRASTVIKSSGFLGMLNFLAQGSNGSLGSASTQSNRLIYQDENIIPFQIGLDVCGRHEDNIKSFNDLRSSIFIFDERGQACAFTEEFKEKQAAEDISSKRGVSGGCPVRHATFKATGPVAGEYFRSQGYEDGLPPRQCESLIERGAKFLSNVLLATVEADAKRRQPDSAAGTVQS